MVITIRTTSGDVAFNSAVDAADFLDRIPNSEVEILVSGGVGINDEGAE